MTQPICNLCGSLECLRETTIILSQNSRCPGRVSDRAPFEHRSTTLPIHEPDTCADGKPIGIVSNILISRGEPTRDGLFDLVRVKSATPKCKKETSCEIP